MAPPVPPFLTGLDRVADGALALAGCRVGLLANMASLDRRFRPAAEVLRGQGADLRRIFAPEHGYRIARVAGDPVADGRDPETGVPVVTLYGARSAPEPGHVVDLDALVIDLPQVGVRCFTYLGTAIAALGAASAAGVETIVLDRPNPLGRRVEGPGRAVGERGLLAPMDLPLRYGLTLGEALSLYAHEAGLPAPRVMSTRGWSGHPWCWAHPWVAPSPALPSPWAALAYSGTVLIEGTSLSEGRGTAMPFLQIGAPELPAVHWANAVTALDLPGVAVRPSRFRPQSSKHCDRDCDGITLHIRDPIVYTGIETCLGSLGVLRDMGDLEPDAMLPFLNRLTADGGDIAAWLRTPGADLRDLHALWEPDHRRACERAGPHMAPAATP